MKEQEKDYGLRPLWNAILPIYGEFRRVCEKYSFRHWATFGTALGAARHKGFIPWDDDFDIMMPRADYERFMKLAPSELPHHLRLVNWRNTDGYQWLFGKVQDIRADNLSNVEEAIGRGLPQGIYMDIFPCDGYPDTLVDKAIHTAKGLAICARREFCTCPPHKRRRPRRLAMIAAGAMLKPFFAGADSLRDFVARNEKRMTARSFDNSEMIATCEVRFSLGLTGSVCPAGVFRSGTIEMAFEDVSVPMLADWQKYLEAVFGDWRKLPPETKRVLTHTNEETAPWRV